jgi:hypothetical protein
MTIAIIWLVAFVFFFYMFLKRWDASVSGMLDKLLPAVLRSEDDRLVLAPALAVLLATAIVSPVEVLLVLILLSLIALVVGKLMGWAMNKADLS